ncbi:titin-like%2C partial, partial [Scomber scombrus]
HLITAKPGDDVTLPCRAPNNVTIAAVKWSRSNLDRYVYLKSDGHLNTAGQDPSYVNRVQLKDDEMKNGELSLILKNVNNKDKGTYECRYMERGGRWERAGDQIKLIVYLKVKDLPITAQPGQTVTLPCRAPNVTIAAVEWIRSDLEKRVYFKSDGHLNTADQDPSYVNRVQLEDDEMKNGELSLILKNVNSNDGGTYVCRYVEKTGRRRKRSDQMKVITSVQLKVKDGDAEGGKDKHQHLGVILPVTLIGLVVACWFYDLQEA